MVADVREDTITNKRDWSRRWESNPAHALIWSFAVYKTARAPYTSPGLSRFARVSNLAYEWHEHLLVYHRFTAHLAV